MEHNKFWVLIVVVGVGFQSALYLKVEDLGSQIESLQASNRHGSRVPPPLGPEASSAVMAPATVAVPPAPAPTPPAPAPAPAPAEPAATQLAKRAPTPEELAQIERLNTDTRKKGEESRAFAAEIPKIQQDIAAHSRTALRLAVFQLCLKQSRQEERERCEEKANAAVTRAEPHIVRLASKNSVLEPVINLPFENKPYTCGSLDQAQCFQVTDKTAVTY